VNRKWKQRRRSRIPICEYEAWVVVEIEANAVGCGHDGF